MCDHLKLIVMAPFSFPNWRQWNFFEGPGLEALAYGESMTQARLRSRQQKPDECTTR